MADALVVDVRDGMAESASVEANPDRSGRDAAGNYVVLRVGRRGFAFYEHLKLGSILVRKGDRVRAGQPLGALGFTGDSTGPHLNFHFADGPATLGAERLPFVFRSFWMCGRYAAIGELGKSRWSESGATGTTSLERPGGNVVVRFAEAVGSKANTTEKLRAGCSSRSGMEASRR